MSLSVSCVPGSPRESQVLLRLHQGASLSASKELTISYGSKSNEELLLLYGFATQDNPHDALMMVCPLPPKNQWDNVMFARVELLQVCWLAAWSYPLHHHVFHCWRCSQSAGGKEVRFQMVSSLLQHLSVTVSLLVQL